MKEFIQKDLDKNLNFNSLRLVKDKRESEILED